MKIVSLVGNVRVSRKRRKRKKLGEDSTWKVGCLPRDSTWSKTGAFVSFTKVKRDPVNGINELALLLLLPRHEIRF